MQPGFRIHELNLECFGAIRVAGPSRCMLTRSEVSVGVFEKHVVLPIPMVSVCTPVHSACMAMTPVCNHSVPVYVRSAKRVQMNY
jgi:hypothetical protein